jgi:hypothetical protein
MYNVYSDPLGEVAVSPGRHDLYLGNSTSLVKLRYPNSSILTNSIGDLLFTVTLRPNTTQPWCDTANLTLHSNCRLSVDIYIPPDFSGLTISNLWTSFTNNYDSHIISLSRQSSSDHIGPNWWRVTISTFNVTSSPKNVSLTSDPKVFLVGKEQYVRLFQVTSPTTAGRYFFKAFINGISIGAKNFPTLVVKASRDPAYISGRLRDLNLRDRNVTNAEGRITLLEGYGAQVVATGIDYLGNPVSAQTFINSSANGQYTLFGVAPGTYNITAYAAGYTPTTRRSTVSVAAAQSLEGVDVYMSKCVNITGTVLSTTANGGPIPWWYVWKIDPTGRSMPTERSISISLLSLDGSTVASFPAPSSFAKTTDHDKPDFTFAIGNQVALDGRIPQDYANFTSGISSGDYLLRAYVTSYVQLDEVRVHVRNETTRTVSEIRLIRTGTFTVTVHFRNSSSTIKESPPDRKGTLTVSAYNQQGILRAQNVTFVNGDESNKSLELQGFSNARSFGAASQFSQNGGILPGTYYFRAKFTSSPSYAGYANIGIRDLYYQTEDIQATIGLGEANVSLSLSMYRAGGIELSLYSIDDQTPPVSRPWGFPGKTIKIEIVDSQRNVYQGNATQLPVDPLHPNWHNVSFDYVGLLTDSYDMIIHTVGYTQREIPHLSVVLGMNTDAAVWMIKDPVIDLTVAFRNEGLLSIINSTQPYAQPINNITATPARIEVFDEQGNFVAANDSYIPNGASYANFTLAGFDQYYGNPRFVWSGFYDTTDARSQTPGGLILYPWNDSPREYTIRIWVDGYYQYSPLKVTVPAGSNASVVGSMHRASRISGTVIGLNFYDEACYLSWATVSLEPNNYTLTGIIDVRPGYYTTASLDGWFQLWVPEGSYGIGVSLAGYASYSAQIAVPSGSDISMHIWLDNYPSSSQPITLRSPVNTIIATLSNCGSISGVSNRLLRKT